MAKFKAKEAVEILEFDFEGFGNGSKGVIQEPTTGLVNGFMKNQKQMMREVQSLQAQAKGLELDEAADDSEEMSDEELAERMAKMDELEAGADLFQKRSLENLAILCGAEWVPDNGIDDPENPNGHLEGGSPTIEDLESLPYRHLQAFMSWLTGEIRPKKERPAGKR